MRLLLWQRWLSKGLKYFYASFIYFCVTQIANTAHCDNVHCAVHSWPADTAEIFSTILTSLLPYFLYISSIQKKFTEVGSSLNYIILRYHLWWNVVLSLTSINQFAESVLGFLAEKWFKHTDEGCWLNCVNLVICICLPWIYLILMQYSIQYRISCCYSDCVGIH